MNKKNLQIRECKISGHRILDFAYHPSMDTQGAGVTLYVNFVLNVFWKVEEITARPKILREK